MLNSKSLVKNTLLFNKFIKFIKNQSVDPYKYIKFINEIINTTELKKLTQY